MKEYIIESPLFIVKTKISDVKYTFISEIKESHIYYEILNSLNDYQLKSLYDFIYKHYIICRDILTDDILRPFSKKKDIDNNLKSFINNDIAKEIFIINLIRVYFR
jgi:hypothetical protein